MKSNNEQEKQSKPREQLIKVKNLDVSFPWRGGHFRAVKKASFEIYEGEILGLVGESGSGKSTIGRTIVALNNSTSGSIVLNDFKYPNNLSNLSKKERTLITNSAQYIFQNPFAALNPNKSIRKAIIDAYKNNYSYRTYTREYYMRHVRKLMTDDFLNIIIPKKIQPTKDELDFHNLYLARRREVLNINRRFHIGVQEAYKDSRTEIIEIVNRNKKKQLSDKDYVMARRKILATRRERLKANKSENSAPLFIYPPLKIQFKMFIYNMFRRYWLFRVYRFVVTLYKNRTPITPDVVSKLFDDNSLEWEQIHAVKEFSKFSQNPIKKKSMFYRDAVEEMANYTALSEELLNKKPREMSGGQQQRAVIARALSVRPKLLVADEPVSAMDVSIQSQVITMLKDLRKRLNVSILFIAHDLNVVRNISDRIIVMLNGELLEEGTSEEIFVNSRHPYTHALLRSIPDIVNANIDANAVHYDFDRSSPRQWHQITPTHRIFCTDEELKKWKVK